MVDFEFEDEGLLDLGNLVMEKPVVLNKTSINMYPTGRDWTQETVVTFLNEDDVLLPDGRSFTGDAYLEEVSEKYIIAEANNYHRHFFELVDCSDYLSYKEWELVQTSPEIMRFRHNNGLSHLVPHFVSKSLYSYNVATKEITLSSSYGCSFCHKDAAPMDFQIRFYKDKTVALLLRIDFDNDVSRYFVVNPAVYENSTYIPGLPLDRNSSDENTYIKKNQENIELLTNLRISNERVFIEITKEEEIQLYKSKIRKVNIFKEITECYSNRGWEFNIETHRDSRRCYRYGDDQTNAFTDVNIVNNFFDINSDENKNVLKEFNTKYPGLSDSRYSTRDIATGITSLYLLVNWCTCNGNSIAIAEKKADYMSELWPTLHFDETHPVWERRGDDIIITYVNRDYSGWRHGAPKSVFVYNTINKTRRFMTSNSTNDNKTMIVPSLDNGILMNLNFTNRKDGDIVTRFPSPILWNDISLKDLFRNTNVEWILDNTTAFNPDFSLCMNDGKCGSTHVYKLAEEVSETNLSIVPVAILATSGTPVLEQLLKNKLFNLYFAVLNNMIDCHEIDDTSRKEHPRDYIKRLAYDGTQTSLKKMFKMTLDQLKFINNGISVIVEGYESCEGYNIGKYLIPAIHGCLPILGIDSYTIIDPKTFEHIIQIGNNEFNGRHYDTIWHHFECSNPEKVRPAMASMNIKQKVEFIDKYAEVFEEYGDYLEMRKQLKTFEATHTVAEKIFSESWYPEKPGNCIKFIRYLEGSTYEHRYSRWHRETETMDEESFINTYINDLYGEGDHIEFKRDDEGNLIGALIKLTPALNVKYLHNEITIWNDMYQNEIERASFNKALERVHPLEWQDEAMGLAMVSPKDPADIRNEGSVLSHCVGSYVEAISKGKDNIMFLRRLDMIDAPYYTVEVVPNTSGKFEIRQVHCYRNGQTSFSDQDSAYENSKLEVYNKHFDVLKFLTKWAKNFSEKIDAASVKDRYGALCHM